MMAVVLAISALLVGMQLVSTTAMAAERAVAQEKNPPGDIPDSQVFVTYISPLGFSLKVPEGWARTNQRDGARFADKYNAVDVAVSSASGAPTTASVTNHEAALLVTVGRAVKIETIKSVKLRSGPAILIVFSSNSEPNAVTNKQLRLENNRYLIYRGGTIATLNLSAPIGADNVDQWKLISNSFQWH
ncbi:MAG TPA: hypothetical protein DCP03_00535 [Polaromonas sp.]|nr:hypothetical protein [Polaromonas sp.]